MSRAAAGAAPSQARRPSPADLGVMLRSVLVSPRAGFNAALVATARRAQAGLYPAETRAPYVLGAAGGAAGMLLWLKVAGLLGRREVTAAQFEWGYLVAAAVTGAMVALLAQALWAVAGKLVLRSERGAPAAAGLRLVWGAAAFPQVGALLVLLPLDLIIVGPATFTTERIEESLAAGWAAVSIALGLSLAVWSAFLMFRGAEIAGSAGGRRALIAVVTAFACALISAAFFAVVALLVAGLA